MSSSLINDLARAAAFLRDHHRNEARALLIDVVRREPRSDQAWFLLSLALDDPAQQRDCLRRALQLNPEHLHARRRLAELDVPQPASPGGPTASMPAPVVPPAPPAPQVHMPAAQRAPAAIEPATARSARFVTEAPAAAPRAASGSVVRTQGSAGWTLWAVIGIGVLATASCVTVAVLYAGGYFEPEPAVVVVSEATPISFPTLPPTWTASPLPTETPVPTATPTRTPTATPTLPPPDSTMAADMDKIAQQVADLRGLAVTGENPRYLVPRNQIEALLNGLLDRDMREELENQKLVLSMLGLVKPTYDLVKYALNSQSDNIGGLYLPWTKTMYVIGREFSGIERFVYSHEYDHALTDAHFDIAGMGVYPLCRSDAQRCSAIRALVEGDATLLMEQWWTQYATPQDYLDIAAYEPPRFTLPEEFPPPAIVADLAFPYDHGYEFVSYLHARGNWAAVNRAYGNLPQSTEQILHPEKYLAAEAPAEVALPPQPSLGEGWRLVDDNVLGEWMTYLILGYGADVSAQLPEDEASDAAQGWGGDHYQVYHEQSSGAAVLVARWHWDSLRDGEEFARALSAYHEQRFRGGQVEVTHGACWESNGQASCLYTGAAETLWLLAPNQLMVEHVLLAFPEV
jgi:hypothetical protein